MSNFKTMIDLVKAKFLDKDRIEGKLISEKDNFPVEGRYSYSFAEKKYPLRSRRENLFINVTEKRATIENSLHKYFNNHVSGQNQNFDDFHLCDILYALDVLEHELDYPLNDTILTSLEFGFNIKMDICPTKFLINNVLMYDAKTPCYDPKNDKNKKIKKFTYTEYEIKIYNKTLDQSRHKQFKAFLKGTKILRVEIKFKSKRLLNEMGIYSLADLKRQLVYQNLMNAFLKKYENLLIIDSYNGNHLMKKKDRKFVSDCTHPNYWSKLKDERHGNTITNHKKKLKKLIKKYDLDTWKKNLRIDLLNKFHELMSLNCFDSQSLSVSA